MRKYNLLHVVFGISSGGVERFLINYFSGSEFNNYNLFIAYYGDADKKCLDELKKCGFTAIQMEKTKNIKKSYLTIKNIIKTYKIDIVHSNINTENYYILRAAKKCNVRVRISHVHGFPYATKNPLKWFVRKIKIMLNKKYSTCNLACSSGAGNYLFGKGNYIVVYNAINVEKFRYNELIRNRVRKELGISNEIVLGYVGRFSKGKNQEFLVDLLPLIKNQNKQIKLLLIGAGTQKDLLLSRIKELKLSNDIIVLSTKENIYDYYQAMDLFVFPSLKEGLGMVAIEAQINNLYCICSNGVSKDTNISNSIIYLPLIKKEWIRAINKHLNIRNSSDNHKYQCDYQKYDISMQRKVLADIYDKECRK